MTFNKTIDPNFSTIGRKRRLTGYIGQVTDETGLVLHSREYGSYREAEIKINALVRELLIDYCEQGLVDELPTFDGSTAAPGGILVVLVDTLLALDPPGPNPEDDSEGDGTPPDRPRCATCGNDGDCLDCEPSLLTDVHSVLSQCLSNQRMGAIVPEIERVLHRVEQALCVELMATV